MYYSGGGEVPIQKRFYLRTYRQAPVHRMIVMKFYGGLLKALVENSFRCYNRNLFREAVLF